MDRHTWRDTRIEDRGGVATAFLFAAATAVSHQPGRSMDCGSQRRYLGCEGFAVRSGQESTKPALVPPAATATRGGVINTVEAPAYGRTAKQKSESAVRMNTRPSLKAGVA
jgi:hypothetical protein